MEKIMQFHFAEHVSIINPNPDFFVFQNLEGRFQQQKLVKNLEWSGKII